MDANNPWQVESREAFYCLKCPECQYFTTDDNGFYHHAVENHPLSVVYFGKPKVETINPEEILGLLVKNEMLENSFEIEDNENLFEKTFETIAEDCNNKSQMKVHDLIGQTEIFERDIDSLKTHNQVKIPDANKPENVESFTETGYGMPENSFEVKSESIITKSQENLYETDQSEIDVVKSTPNETEGIKIMNPMKENKENLENDALVKFKTSQKNLYETKKSAINVHEKKKRYECDMCDHRFTEKKQFEVSH